MIKWQIAAILGVVFGIAGIGWGYAQQTQAPGFYEKQGYRRFGGMSGSPKGESRHFYVKHLRAA